MKRLLCSTAVFSVIFSLTSSLTIAGPNKNPDLLPKPARFPSGQYEADPLVSKSWHLKKIGAYDAWKVSKGSPDTIIAIVDSGINYNHPDLAANIRWKMSEMPMNGQDKDHNGFIDDVIGWDFVLGRALPYDRSGHGTFLAGIIAAVEGNGTGSVGVCPECSILPVRFLNYDGLGETEDAIKGLYYATDSGAKVINFSFSGVGIDHDLEKAIIYAGSKDALVIASASNDGLNLDYQSIYPAKFNLPNLITIAATDQNNEFWEDSNWGRRSVHFAAPGVDILGPWFEKWDTGSGTSDAAAVVSGAAGVLRTAAPHLTAAQIKQVLISTVHQEKHLLTKLISGGVMDLAAAVQCATDSTLPCLHSDRK